MKLFEIYTEENGKDVDFGIHGVYTDSQLMGNHTTIVQIAEVL